MQRPVDVKAWVEICTTEKAQEGKKNGGVKGRLLESLQGLRRSHGPGEA